jgi:hypothetical protein
MDDARAKQLVSALPIGSDALTAIARTASRHKKSIATSGDYADRFHAELRKLVAVEKLILPTIRSIAGFDSAPLENYLETIKATASPIQARDVARRQIRLICETDIEPNIGNVALPVQPAGEPLLAAAVLAKAPSYLQRSLLQANGTYVNRWFDASSVMIRKLVENAIIDVYEARGKESEIRNAEGEYQMLSALIAAILRQTHWSLGRETKKALPAIKQLGDRAAHNRRYEATKQDVDQVLPGLRAAIDDLLHLAGHK